MKTSQDKPDTLDTPSLEADSEKSGRPGTQAGDLEMTRVDVQPTTRGSAPLGTRKEKTTKEEESDSARKKQNGRDSHSPHEDGDPGHSTMFCTKCTPHNSFPCRILFFIIMVALDVADLVSDWLFYADVSISEAGLVYGPPGDAAVYSLLAFSIIGSFTFIFEVTNLWWEVFRNNPWLDADLVSAVTIWIEDLPQIAINVYIAWCREDPISVFQLSKAAVVLIALLVRFIISSVKYCNKAALREAREKTAESKRHVAYRVFIMLGLIINAACAITVFVFTQTQRDPHGGIKFQVPKTVFEDRYNDERYFQNVSVFINHPAFDIGTTTGVRTNWVRFMSIDDIRDKDDLNIYFNYIYDRTSSGLAMAFFEGEKTSNGNTLRWKLAECILLNSGIIQVQTNTSCLAPTNFLSSAATSVFITFSFEPPDRIFRKLVFGDIRFNIKMKQNNICKVFDNFTNDIKKNLHLPAIHYFRTNATIPANNISHLLLDGGQHRFYRNDGLDLQDITEVWRTGWGQCDMSGSKAPHLERDIPSDCSNSALPHVTG